MKKLGYREMLRDRCPKVTNYALKWLKVKEKWIDHVYDSFVRLVGDEWKDGKLLRTSSENKNIIVRIVMGIVNGKVKHFDFDKTIDWDNLTDEEKARWKRVSSWVKWFGTNYAYIENTYDISKKTGKDEESVKIEIINSYLRWLMPTNGDSEEVKQAKYQYIDNFVNYLIRCFEGKN
jgi:hypothetical protein